MNTLDGAYGILPNYASTERRSAEILRALAKTNDKIAQYIEHNQYFLPADTPLHLHFIQENAERAL